MTDFENLRQQILNCRLCRDRFGFEPRPFFWGSARSKIFQVSQAPSLKVHLSGKPFDDASGRRLLQWYDIDAETFYNTDNFYITALSHCYPGKNSQGTDKSPGIYCAHQWMEKEMKAVENKLYIIIGSQAAKYFFPEIKFDFLVFHDMTLNNKPAIVVPHPSPLNFRWLKTHPEFIEKRLPQIRLQIKQELGIK